MEPNKESKPVQPTYHTKPKLPMPIIAALITLSVLAGVLLVIFLRNSKQLSEARDSITYVEEQKTQLESELNELIIGYDSLKTESDSMNQQLASEQDKIRRLLRLQASNSTKIKMYEKELKTLRQVMRSYIVQIDSLNTRNRELTEENVAVRGKLKQAETDYQELSQTKEILSSKVALAQKLTAKNIIPVGLNGRSKEKDKIGKIDKLRVCFTIRENNVAEAGKKIIYLQIIRPDEVILSSPEAGMYEYQDQTVVYTAKRELEYDNLDIDMCIYWDKNEELIPGTYTAILYCEGYDIGSATFDLK
jgi:uncharacterized coiled-coil DUF342 family protein